MVLPWVEDETVDSSDEEALDNSEARVGGYGGAKKAYLIEEVERRAITIKQLRTLHSFLQYLTKTEVLKHTSEFSRTTGMHNKLIPWTSLNMYDITTEVIKKVIPHVDPEGEHIDDERRWYSWVEFVAAKEQPAQIMLSHWWGGRFMDFMQSVDKMALDRSLSIYTPIWICTFANCQFGENFGSKLMDCPFICTLKTVNLTVLIVDFQGGSLTRTWCGLEVHYTTHNEIDFALYTSAGRVGSTYVSGGPLVEAVKNWDIRTSEASDPPYRRQILNYVAKVSELEGLEKDEEGQLVLDNMGRPQLSSDALDPHGAMRSSGEKEFAHEANLFRKHAKRFEHLNMMVRLRVMATLGLPKKPKGCTVAEVALRGVTLNQLRVMSAKLESSCPWSEDDEEECPWGDDLSLDEGQSLCYEELTIEHVAAWIKFQTAMVWEGEGPGSYMEIISDGPQKPQFAVTFSQSQLWHERMSAIEVFAEAQQLPDSAIFFVEVCGRNIGSGDDEEEWKLIRTESEGILCILSTEMAMNESEAELSIAPLVMQVSKDKGIFFASPGGVLACSQPFRNGTWVHGDFDTQVVVQVLKLLLKDMDEDADDVDDMDLATFRALLRLHQWLAGPFLRRAAKFNDVQAIKDICSLPGLRLTSDTMKDNLGRVPLHVAIACGSREAMKVLLEAKMDPNVEDNMSDRPLHYAALAGQADLVQELVAAGADVWSENCFGETALQVAMQNPGAFVGVNTSKVCKVLKGATKTIPERQAFELFRAFVKDPPRNSADASAGSAAAAARKLKRGGSRVDP